MSCGIPCVSFDCPHGPSDIIKDYEDGLLVEKENIKELADKICYLIENENVRIKMGHKARERKTLSAGKCDATMEKLIRIINLFF